jgi:uncharacterized protein
MTICGEILVIGSIRLRFAAGLAIIALLFADAGAQAEMPTLSGRIVDAANIIAAPTRSSLDARLAELETRSGIQLVVATVPSLDGQEIEPYANALFRKWKVGESSKNNGVLLLVAPNQHKVRIEVGYGLEGTLTDAISKIIISNAMVPSFKSNDFSGGIMHGVDDIITVLTTDSAEWQPRPKLRVDEQDNASLLLPILFIVLWFVLVLFLSRRFGNKSGQIVRRGGNVIFIPPSGISWGEGSSSGGSLWGRGGDGGFSGGGFSGGGGSSGGGGASGSW